jgi:hypothetical protein
LKAQTRPVKVAMKLVAQAPGGCGGRTEAADTSAGDGRSLQARRRSTCASQDRYDGQEEVEMEGFVSLSADGSGCLEP